MLGYNLRALEHVYEKVAHLGIVKCARSRIAAWPWSGEPWPWLRACLVPPPCSMWSSVASDYVGRWGCHNHPRAWPPEHNLHALFSRKKPQRAILWKEHLVSYRIAQHRVFKFHEIRMFVCLQKHTKQCISVCCISFIALSRCYWPKA